MPAPAPLCFPCTELPLVTALEVALGTRKMLAAPLPHWAPHTFVGTTRMTQGGVPPLPSESPLFGITRSNLLLAGGVRPRVTAWAAPVLTVLLEPKVWGDSLGLDRSPLHPGQPSREVC